MTTRLKVTVVKMFTPEDFFGPDHGITYSGEEIPPCFLKLGQEFIVNDHRDRPAGFCRRAWHDLYTTLMAYY